MKAIAYDRFGGLDELHPADLPDPSPGQGEVLVKIMAVSANVIDNRARSGMMGPLVKKKFPRIPGADLAGVVAAVGPGVTEFRAGDAVFGALDPFKGGAAAEMASVPAKQLAPKPPSLSFQEAAALPIAGLAALQALRDLGGVKRGDRVLIHGASGGVGLLAVQIGKALGARVTAVASGEGLALAQTFGADVGVDYRRPSGDAAQGPFKLILNASGKMPFASGRPLLAADGVLVEPSPTIPLFIGANIANLFRRQKHKPLATAAKRQDLEVLAKMVADRALTPTIAKAYPFADAKKAFADLERGGAIGKLVIVVQA